VYGKAEFPISLNLEDRPLKGSCYFASGIIDIQRQWLVAMRTNHWLIIDCRWKIHPEVTQQHTNYKHSSRVTKTELLEPCRDQGPLPFENESQDLPSQQNDTGSHYDYAGTAHIQKGIKTGDL
jgi:hypothetical protein